MTHPKTAWHAERRSQCSSEGIIVDSVGGYYATTALHFASIWSCLEVQRRRNGHAKSAWTITPQSFRPPENSAVCKLPNQLRNPHHEIPTLHNNKISDLPEASPLSMQHKKSPQAAILDPTPCCRKEQHRNEFGLSPTRRPTQRELLTAKASNLLVLNDS